FVSALRRMHGELGYSLKDLEGRLPASRSSLSRYLRGQSLPDERLLVQWCKLSFTGEDRLPALVELLHRANEAADGTPTPVAEAAGGHSSRWFQVDHGSRQAWMPGIRIRPEQLENNDLPHCPD